MRADESSSLVSGSRAYWVCFGYADAELYHGQFADDCLRACWSQHRGVGCGRLHVSVHRCASEQWSLGRPPRTAEGLCCGYPAVCSGYSVDFAVSVDGAAHYVQGVSGALRRHYRVCACRAGGAAAGADGSGAQGGGANGAPGSEGYVLVSEDGSWTATEPDGDTVTVYYDGSWTRTDASDGHTDLVGIDGSWVKNEGNTVTAVQYNGAYNVMVNGQATSEKPTDLPDLPVVPNTPGAATPKTPLNPTTAG